MAIQITCPQCGRVASISDPDKGASVQCGGCATVFDVAVAPDRESQPSQQAKKLLAAQEADEQWARKAWDIISTPLLILLRFLGNGPQLPVPVSSTRQAGLAVPAHPSSLAVCPVCGAAWPKDSSRCRNCHWDCIQARHISPTVAPPMPPGLGLHAPTARPPDPYELSVCSSCGSNWKRFALQCTVCNWDPVRKRHVAPRETYSDGNGTLSGGEKTAGCLLALFLGGFGAHRFFLGHYGVAIFQLLLTLANAAIGIAALLHFPQVIPVFTFPVSCLITIWIIIDGIRILSGSLYRVGGGPVRHSQGASGTSGLSVAALVLALVSLFVFPPFVGLAALICAVIGLATSESKGLAVIALLLSIACPIAGMFMGAIIGLMSTQ